MKENNIFSIKKFKKRWKKSESNLKIYSKPLIFDKTAIKPRTDTGFIEEEVIVPIDHFIKSRGKNGKLRFSFYSSRSYNKPFT